MSFYNQYEVGDIVKANFYCGIVREVATTARHYDDFHDEIHEVPLRNPIFRVEFFIERQHRWVTLDTAQVWFYDDLVTYWLFPDELNLVCSVQDANYAEAIAGLGLESLLQQEAA